MSVWRARRIGYVAALIAALSFAAVRSAPLTIAESGSTLIYPLFKSWIAAYTKVAPDLQMTADPSGSRAVATAFLFPILLATIGTRLLLDSLVIASLLGALVTRLFQIETTGVNLDRIGEEASETEEPKPLFQRANA